MSSEKLLQVFASNIPDKVSEVNVKEMFSCCGRIEEMRAQYDQEKGEKGYLITYSKVTSARSACALDGSDLAGVKITVTGNIAEVDKAAADARVVGGVEGMKAVLQEQQTATPGEQLMSLIQNNQATATGVTTTVAQLAEEQEVKNSGPCRICTSNLHPTESCPTLDSVSTSSSSSSSHRKRRKRSSKKGKKDSKRRSNSSKKDKKSSRRRR